MQNKCCCIGQDHLEPDDDGVVPQQVNELVPVAQVGRKQKFSIFNQIKNTKVFFFKQGNAHEAGAEGVAENVQAQQPLILEGADIDNDTDPNFPMMSRYHPVLYKRYRKKYPEQLQEAAPAEIRNRYAVYSNADVSNLT